MKYKVLPLPLSTLQSSSLSIVHAHWPLPMRNWKFDEKLNKSVTIIISERLVESWNMAEKRSCQLCLKTFSNQSGLLSHRLTCNRETEYKCEQCDKMYKRKDGLKTHLLTHRGERHNNCSQCNKSFSQAGHLKRHLLTHTGEKTHKCTKCNYSTTTADHLHRHIMSHNALCGYPPK